MIFRRQANVIIQSHDKNFVLCFRNLPFIPNGPIRNKNISRDKSMALNEKQIMIWTDHKRVSEHHMGH